MDEHGPDRVGAMPARRRRHCRWALVLAAALMPCAGGCAGGRDTAAGPELRSPHAVMDLPADWIDHEPAGEGFGVRLPGAPSREEEVLETALGGQTIVRYKIRREAVEYDVGFLRRSRHPLSSFLSERRLLEMACAGTTEHLHGEEIRSRGFTFDGYAARELEIEIDAASDTANDTASHVDGPPRAAIAWLVITPRRIYHVIIAEPATDTLSADGRRVLESFRLTP